MGYLFLTGSTGLLGSYLIRDLLRAGVRLAVLARSSRVANARHRIESQMHRWEKQAGKALPRPVVFEGDITRPNLGLNEADLAWVKENVTSFMHNAASLTFQAESPESEPYISNVTGTQNVLDVCRVSGIREFFHVSTAYVAGMRTDRVMESELDVGQKHGNDYEISKFRSETMVREAEFLDKVTVYRPGIILGDSRDGYTATFHGFYVPLKLISTSIKQTASLAKTPEELEMWVRAGADRLRSVMSMDGSESKYFVPVDWVSAAMTQIFINPEHHEKTYHLTPREPVSIAMVQRVLEDISLEYGAKSSSTGPPIDWDNFERTFLEGMTVYKSYWNNDPQYDCTNVITALPELPCPQVDEKMLQLMCRYALDVNFGWPMQPVVKPAFDVEDHLKAVHQETPAPGSGSLSLGLRVTGQGGGEWELKMNEGRLVSVQPGIGSRCTATYFLNSKTFSQIASHPESAYQGINTGRILVEGNGVPLEQLTQFLQNLAEKKLPPV
ncbi:MAG: SDR family oxidoreductase [Planctomycetaceae bacterium]